MIHIRKRCFVKKYEEYSAFFIDKVRRKAIYDDGSEYYYDEDGNRHKEDGPAVIELQREDGKFRKLYYVRDRRYYSQIEFEAEIKRIGIKQ